MKNKKKFIHNSNNAITLISLVITIVVLIILVGVAIYLSLGNNGIFTRAKQAKELTNKQEATDIINLKITTAQMNKYVEKQEMPTLKELSLILKEDSEIQYVTETSKVASTEYDVPSESPTSIYTKLNKYPYEFEINGRLQLASINGVKIATTNNGTMQVPKLLWQNTDPTNTNGFAAQTITLAENNCDIFEIYYYPASYDSHLLTQRSIVNNNTRLFNVGLNAKSQGTITHYRNVNINSNNSLVFEDAYCGWTGQAPYVDNLGIIPVYILGYETGVFSQNN